MTGRDIGAGRGGPRRLVAALALALAALAAAGPGAAPGRAAPLPPEVLEQQARLLTPARAALAEAEALGAKGRLPGLHAELSAQLADLAARIAADPARAGAGALDAEAAAATARAARLARQARLVEDLRRQKHPWEAVVRAHERDLAAAARAAGVSPAPELGGTDLARAVIDSLGRRRLRCQALADSLNAERRLESETLRLELAERDSALAALQRRVSDLQQGLWEMTLKAGVVAAEREAVETRLRRQRERAATVRRLAEEFAAEGGEVALTADGAVTLRLPALAFAPNATEVTDAMGPALDRLVRAITALEGAAARVEGHTDNSGGRATNRRLAQGRADAVAAALAARLGWAADAVAAVGVGPDRPIAPNGTAAGRARNRRIDVVVPPPPEFAQ